MGKREEFLFNLFFYKLLLILIFFSYNSFSQNQTIKNFSNSKKILLKIHKKNPYTFYCGCSYKNKTPNLSSCGYKIFENNKRAKRIEFEHIVPASRFGKKFQSWTKGHLNCVKNNGKKYKGRKCSRKVDENFRLIEADMYNLQPTIGEVNQLRKNFKMSIISGEKRIFGKGDVEIKNNKCEGFVRMKDIPNDFFDFNRKTNTVIGQNTLEEYSLGDDVRIEVIKTNVEKKHIDFKILD